MLSYRVRLMRREDAVQVAEIDHEAFSTQWPPVNYENELRNRLAHYIVACDEEKKVKRTKTKPSPEKYFSGLSSRVRQFFSHDHPENNKLTPLYEQYIIGFAGLWILADEAHITSIAVRKPYRQRGIGELLIISTLELASELNTNIVTLEVRTSNAAAQNLYQKYGFIRVGLRRGYYTDNNEDAVLMTVENINTASFQTNLNRLKQAYSRKWGVALHQMAQ